MQITIKLQFKHLHYAIEMRPGFLACVKTVMVFENLDFVTHW